MSKSLIEQIGNLTVFQLSELVKGLETEFNVSAAMPMAAAPAASSDAAPAAKQEEKTEFKVTLKEAGAESIKVIKALRSVISTLGLVEAKKAVVEAPTVIAEAVSKEDAKKIKEALEAAGAKVELS